MRDKQDSPILSEITSLGGFGRAWSVGIILFSATRALLAWPALGRYGVNPWLFLGLDLLTAPPYGISQAVTVKILRDPTRPPRDAFGWGTVVVAMFLAPYAYIFLVSGEMPVLAYAGLLAWIVLFGSLAVFRMVRQVRAPVAAVDEGITSETNLSPPRSAAEAGN